ncbi:MAG: fumarylacetoacetate hydrolase family protein [Desulfobacteraceae bacterium]
MRLAQYYHHGTPRLGMVQETELEPCSFSGDMIDFINSPRPLDPSGPPIPLDRVRLAPAVSRPSKIIAIGLNYLDHVEESKGTTPEAPLVFAKFPNSLVGHGEPVVWDPAVSSKVDFEAELAVIIGQKVYRAEEEDIMEAVFGYTCGNDVSARDIQFGDGQWVRGKSLDTFCPLGPWIVTKNEIPDPHELSIRCLLNGQVMQESGTDRMIFLLPALLAYLSRHFTLYPGDVVLTGTPAGVGVFRHPPVYLQDGDVVSVAIQGLGVLTNPCIAVEAV